MFEKLNSKILLIVVFSCLICLSIAVGVARHFNQKELHSGIVDKSRAIHSRLRAATAFVANQGGLKPIIDSMTAKYKSSTEMTDEDKRAVLAQVPVFAAMKIGAEGAEQEHYSFRVFSDEPRRKENKATLAELEIFKKFEADPELLEWVSDDAKVVTVFRPIRISEKQGCLNCHGNPSMSPWGNGEDVLGYKMENWRDGKLHGVFALITNIDDVKAAKAKIELMSTDKQIGLFIGVGLILALVIAAVLVRGPLSRVKSVSEKLVSDSNDVGSAVSQIFSISQELSHASNQQSASVQETASAIEEISAMIRKSSDNAEESEKASLASKASADRGRKMVQKMVMAMTEINQRNDKVSEAVHSGNQKISQIVSVIQDIGNKTKVINEIVFQTKLLSFNASVEAARAGEHGKGFAVVAEEIGNLAAMSGRSAKEITALLDQSLGHVKNIVEETKTTVGSLVTESKASVKEGTKIAHECEVILSEIVTSSSHVSELVNGISLASQEQSNGVTEISKAIQQIDRTTDVGVVSAKNCGVAAEQLAEKVNGLRRASADLRLVIEGKTTVTKFRWASEYQIGVQEMDAEHKVLIEKINALAENLELTNDSRRDKAVKRAFSALAEYTRIHFNHEESYMESIKYPDLDAHKATHRKLLSQVVEFSSKIDEGQYDSAELMNFLNDWLMRHILGVDMKYGKYAKAASAQHWKNAV